MLIFNFLRIDRRTLNFLSKKININTTNCFLYQIKINSSLGEFVMFKSLLLPSCSPHSGIICYCMLLEFLVLTVDFVIRKRNWILKHQTSVFTYGTQF